MASYFVSPEELDEIVKSSKDDYLVLDSRTKKEYESGHIPGAVSISWEDWNEKAPQKTRSILKSPGYWGKLACPEEGNFAQKLGNLGISNDRKIIVYGEGKASKGREGRIAWMLLYLGHQMVAVLDGGIKSWKALNLPVVKETPVIKRASFQIALKPERRLLLKDLVSRLGTDQFPVMLDTRTRNEFEGKVFWYQPNKGRIPDSHLIVYNDIFTEKEHFISKEAYKTCLPEGYEKASNVGTYCEVGVRTCTVSLLHEEYTGQVLPVYDGSIMEWSFHKELPLLRK